MIKINDIVGTDMLYRLTPVLLCIDFITVCRILNIYQVLQIKQIKMKFKVLLFLSGPAGDVQDHHRSFLERTTFFKSQLFFSKYIFIVF